MPLLLLCLVLGRLCVLQIRFTLGFTFHFTGVVLVSICYCATQGSSTEVLQTFRHISTDDLIRSLRHLKMEPKEPPTAINTTIGKTFVNFSWVPGERLRNLGFKISYIQKSADGEWEESEEINSTQAFYQLQGLQPGTHYHLKILHSNLTHWEKEIQTHGLVVSEVKNGFATQGWFICLISAVVLLLLVLLILCFIKRSKGGKYSVKDKEEGQVDSEARPMKDEAFGEYRSLESDNVEKPSISQPAICVDTKMGSDDSLADCSEGADPDRKDGHENSGSPSHVNHLSLSDNDEKPSISQPPICVDTKMGSDDSLADCSEGVDPDRKDGHENSGSPSHVNHLSLGDNDEKPSISQPAICVDTKTGSDDSLADCREGVDLHRQDDHENSGSPSPVNHLSVNHLPPTAHAPSKAEPKMIGDTGGYLEMIDTFDRPGSAEAGGKYAITGANACGGFKNKPMKRVPKADAYAAAGVGYAGAEWSVFSANAKGPNASAEASASLANGVGAMARAGVCSASASAGPVAVKVGLGVDTGARVGPDGVEVKFLGTGVSLGLRPGVAFLGNEAKCSIM